MAFHGPAYGLDVDARERLDAKWDAEIAAKVVEWIHQVIGVKINDFHKDLKDGILLCNFIIKLAPGSCKPPQKPKAPFIMMENLNAYLMACRSIGLKSQDLFQTVDLYEAKNLSLVLMNLHALYIRYHT